MTVPREWLLELLGAGEPVGRPAAADLTVQDLAVHFGRAPSTVRGWIEADRFPGAYRFRGREWRVTAAGLAAFEAREREGGPAATATASDRSSRGLRGFLKGTPE